MSLNQINNIINLLSKENILYTNLLEKYLINVDDIEAILLSKFLLSNYISQNNISNPKQIEKQISETILEIKNLEEKDILSKIKCLKDKLFSLIAQGFYGQIFDFSKTSELISESADLILSKIFTYCTCMYKKNYGLDLENDIFVIALGKLGGYELNFSSDVDLVFLSSNELSKPLNNFVHLFNKICTQNLSNIFRIDLNLRPGGANSKPIHSIEEAVNYYYRWGQAWERIALIKTRFLFGSKVLFNQFCTQIKPFIYKKYLDYSTIDEYRTIKKIMACQNQNKFNLKTSVGGIRYLEFYASVSLLIFSGRIHSMQKLGLSFTQIITLLFDNNIIKIDDKNTIMSNYNYLRDLENILQSLNNMQTQNISDGDLKKILYIKYGFEFLDDKNKYFQEHKKILSYNSNLFDSLLKDDFCENEFKSDSSIIKKIINNINASHASSEIKNKISKLVFYIKELDNVDKETVFIRLNILISKLSTKLSVLLVFYENKELIDKFLNILIDGGYIYNEIIKYPELIDVFILDFEDEKTNYRINMLKTMHRFISEDDDVSQRFEKLKLFKTFEEIKISQLFLDGKYNIMQVNNALSHLSKKIIHNICTFLDFESTKFCVFTQGALGAHDMNFKSDLDLIFVCDFDDVSIFQSKSKQAKKLINYISTKGKFGELYNIDLRLKPSVALPVICNLQNFISYYSNETDFLEDISFWKLSYIWGDKKLAKKILKFKYDYLKNVFFKKIINNEYEIKKLKNKFQNEYGTDNLKFRDGGLMDFEYLVRYLQSKNKILLKNILLAASFLKIDNKIIDSYIELKKFDIYNRLEIKSNLDLKISIYNIKEFYNKHL